MKKIILKKYFILISILFFTLDAYNQGNSCTLPNDDQYWKIGSSYGSKRLANCTSFTAFNCHGFVRAYFEDGCTQPSWDGSFVPDSFTCPNPQGTSGNSFDTMNEHKYIQVCQESDAKIATFTSRGDLHSCVKDVTSSNGIKYISKYGSESPLVAHDLNASWYHLHFPNFPPDNLRFWTYIGSINGNTNITGLSPVSFFVNNNTGINYSWSVVSGHSNIYISSSSTQNTVTLTPTHSGTATLRLDINSGCGNPKFQEITLNIQTNVCLEGTYTNNNSSSINLNNVNSVSVGGVTATVNCPDATSYIWSKTSGNINGWTSSGNFVSFGMTSGGSISFSITAKNGGTTLGQRSVTFHNYGSFRIAPNPAVDIINVDLNRNLSFNILIQSLDGLSRKEIVNYTNSSPINISTLPSGVYSILIYFKDTVVNQQQIIINRP